MPLMIVICHVGRQELSQFKSFYRLALAHVEILRVMNGRFQFNEKTSGAGRDFSLCSQMFGDQPAGLRKQWRILGEDRQRTVAKRPLPVEICSVWPGEVVSR